MQPPDLGDTWVGLTDQPLPVHVIGDWAVRPDCGAMVLFSGTARDHAADRPDVSLLEYEAYESQVEPRLLELAGQLRERWPELGRIAMIHRVGALQVGESAVVVAVSSPHRQAAFEAAAHGIDALKQTVPIWKRERWAGGESWGLEAQHITDVAAATEQASAEMR
ncbi:MAG: molybdenum cofactor biosynthesis protein MoaE [Acidimicrobiales bacterium]